MVKRFHRAYMLALVLAVATGVGPAAAEPAASGAAWPTAVTARYKLFFAGFEVGSYNFSSTTTGNAYAANGSASVSALFGAFKWKGGIESNGTLEAEKPSPRAYKLDFKAKKKHGSITLGFDKGAVAAVSVVPEKPPHPTAVPIKPGELQGVFDPMSSILALTHAGKTDPCKRTIPIFDGKARFDLVLSPKGTVKLSEQRPSGQPAHLKVCTVKYVPVSGHKPKDFVDPWVAYDQIEIALRPVPAANVYVPYRVTIPTSIGAAVMQAETVNITAPNKTQIALRQ